MNQHTMERPGIRAGLAAGIIRRRGTARLLHISRILQVKEFLELSEEQVEELRTIRIELARKLIKLTADIRTTRFDSFNTLSNKPVNFEQLRNNAKNVSQLRLQRKTAVIDAFEKASKVLSEEQKEKLSECVASWVDEYESEAHESEE
jgi:exonuclease VII large subunit